MAEPKKVVSGSVWQAGMVAVVAIYGIAWLSDTYFVAYKGEMMTAMKDIVNAYPWAIAFVLFTVNFDQSGTTVIGKYLLNHSFMIPGLISVIVSTIVGYLLANLVY